MAQRKIDLVCGHHEEVRLFHELWKAERDPNLGHWGG
jgi:hypothetical protein